MSKYDKSETQHGLWYRDAWKSVNLQLRKESDEWSGNPPLAPGQWTFRKYRYADGRVHRDTTLVVFYADPSGEVHVVGGAVILRHGDVFAYIGNTNPAERARDVTRTAAGVVWGTNLMRVLQDLKKQFPDPLQVLRATEAAPLAAQHAVAG
jgi:hypothetical protein